MHILQSHVPTTSKIMGDDSDMNSSSLARKLCMYYIVHCSRATLKL